MTDPSKQSLQGLMKQAQEMQSKMQDAQNQLTSMVVTGEAGAGMVKVDMNGRHEVLKVVIDPNLLDEEISMIQDLFGAAVNNAVQKIEKEARKKMADLTKDMGLPDGGDAGGFGGFGGTGGIGG